MSQQKSGIPLATGIQHRFEIAYRTVLSDGIDITQLGVEGFRESLLAEIPPSGPLHHLAVYALNDAFGLISHINRRLPEDLDDEQRRSVMHVNAQRLMGPQAGMTNLGNEEFKRQLAEAGDDPDVVCMAHNPLTGGPFAAWAGFDFEALSGHGRGCPALDLDASDILPKPEIEGANVDNLAVQFFHLAIDAAFNDPDFGSTTEPQQVDPLVIDS